MKKVFFYLLITTNIFAQTNGSGVTDIDGNQYNTVIIGTQEWMAENLRSVSFSNGDPIDNVTLGASWSSLSSPAWSSYENSTLNEGIYGVLYNWYVIQDSRNICPADWNIPTNADFVSLINYLGGELIAGGKLKEVGTTHWSSPNTSATNESGFTGLPAGYRANGGSFSDITNYGFWWSSSTETATSASIMYLHYNNATASIASGNVRDGLSIRCVKPASSTGLIEMNSNEKVLLKITDVMGKETEFKPNTVLIYVYSDGTTEKVLQIEP